jgi:hypothetical protein
MSSACSLCDTHRVWGRFHIFRSREAAASALHVHHGSDTSRPLDPPSVQGLSQVGLPCRKSLSSHMMSSNDRHIDNLDTLSGGGSSVQDECHPDRPFAQRISTTYLTVVEDYRGSRVSKAVATERLVNALSGWSDHERRTMSGTDHRCTRALLYVHKLDESDRERERA